MYVYIYMGINQFLLSLVVLVLPYQLNPEIVAFTSSFLELTPGFISAFTGFLQSPAPFLSIRSLFWILSQNSN